MRVAGWILLIAGALLCATLVWATIGFLLMGVGLLSLVVAENQRRRAGSADPRGAGVNQPMTPAPPIPEPALRREPPMEMDAPASAYDRQAWQRLVASDADLARVTSVLADYGQRYVDELATEYLAAGDKMRLPEIVDGIIARAGEGASPRDNRKLESDARPTHPVATPNEAAPRSEQPRPLPAVKSKHSEKLSVSPTVEQARQEIAGASKDPPTAFDPEPDAGDGKRIISADEELTAMLGRLSQDAATPSKS